MLETTREIKKVRTGIIQGKKYHIITLDADEDFTYVYEFIKLKIFEHINNTTTESLTACELFEKEVYDFKEDDLLYGLVCADYGKDGFKFYDEEFQRILKDKENFPYTNDKVELINFSMIGATLYKDLSHGEEITLKNMWYDKLN